MMNANVFFFTFTYNAKSYAVSISRFFFLFSTANLDRLMKGASQIFNIC